MAKAPKDELAIKNKIASLVTAANIMESPKLADNIWLKNKTTEYVKNGTLGNLAVVKEEISYWLLIPCKSTTDFRPLETSINEATDSSFNGLQIVTQRENVIDGNRQRYIEIKVN